jgi:hypothetical protein
MSKQLVITTEVSILGDMSQDDTRRILESIEAGCIDLPQLQLLRNEFQPHGAPWRFQFAVTGAAIVAEGVKP